MNPGPYTAATITRGQTTIRTVVLDQFTIAASKPAVTRDGAPVVTVDGELFTVHAPDVRDVGA